MFRQRIDQEGHKKCLSYLQEEMKLWAFRQIEELLFNEVFVQYHDGQADIPREKLINATKRVVQSAQEILRRRQKITSVPEIASSMFYAYQKRYEDYLSLKQEQANIITELTPSIGDTNRLEESWVMEKKSREIAMKEEKKLLGQLKLSDSEIMKMRADAVAIVKAEKWQTYQMVSPHWNKPRRKGIK